MANIPSISVYPDPQTLDRLEVLKAVNPDKSTSALIVDLINTLPSEELKTKNIGCRIEESKLLAFEVKAKSQGKTISAMIQVLIDDFLQDQNSQMPSPNENYSEIIERKDLIIEALLDALSKVK